mmetsp:Transcript_46488/g.92343  ORF Transcript_46488/g.92343 Transcript_46488/m.92343 type:complete len:445 (+) Transcript_46488:82-1416(+)
MLVPLLAAPSGTAAMAVVLLSLMLLFFTAVRRRRYRPEPAVSLSPVLSVVETCDRGKVLVTQHAFQQGDIVFSEVAALAIPSRSLPLMGLGQLQGAKRRQFMALHCPEALSAARPEDGVGALSAVVGEQGAALEQVLQKWCGWSYAKVKMEKAEAWRFLRIWDANKLSWMGRTEVEQGVFVTLSRMNHSCEPNVRLMPGMAEHELVVYAVRDIAAGDELCLCYVERNCLPMLHFLHLPTECRQHLLLRWGFLCVCPRCNAREDSARTFRCPNADLWGASGIDRCQGFLMVLPGHSNMGCCSVCGKAPDTDAVTRMLLAEKELRVEAEQELSAKLRHAASAAEFPIDAVLSLLKRCIDAGLAAERHWLTFWLQSLALIGSGAFGEDLRIAVQGVARSSKLPQVESVSSSQVKTRMEKLRKVINSDLPQPHRPGITGHVETYFSFG